MEHHCSTRDSGPAELYAGPAGEPDRPLRANAKARTLAAHAKLPWDCASSPFARAGPPPGARSTARRGHGRSAEPWRGYLDDMLALLDVKLLTPLLDFNEIFWWRAEALDTTLKTKFQRKDYN